MAFQDSYSRPDRGGANAARHRVTLAIAAQLAQITRVLDASVTAQFSCDDRWFYFTADGVRYSVAAALVKVKEV
jgi:hypothetical protein